MQMQGMTCEIKRRTHVASSALRHLARVGRLSSFGIAAMCRCRQGECRLDSLQYRATSFHRHRRSVYLYSSSGLRSIYLPGDSHPGS